MKQVKDFINKFLLELLIIGVGSVGSILWVFHGQIVALESGRQTNRDNIELLRQDIKDLAKENKDDHKDILDILRKK